MIRTLGSISGILCAVILFLNFLSYFLKDIYLKIDNPRFKKTINLILPVISKHNTSLISICFISFLIHISCFFVYVNFFNFDILGLWLLLMIITFSLKIIPKSTYDYLRKTASYIILFFIIFHIFKHF